jgi:hypothetical protein
MAVVLTVNKPVFSVNTEAGVIKTTCKTLYSPIVVKGEYKGKCKACFNRNPSLAEACYRKQAEKAKKAKKTKKTVKAKKRIPGKRQEMAGTVISLLNQGKTTKEIFPMVRENFKKDITCTGFVNAVRCVFNQYQNVINSKIPAKQGAVYKYMQYLVNGGDEPRIDGSSKNYCHLVFSAINKIKQD